MSPLFPILLHSHHGLLYVRRHGHGGDERDGELCADAFERTPILPALAPYCRRRGNGPVSHQLAQPLDHHRTKLFAADAVEIKRLAHLRGASFFARHTEHVAELFLPEQYLHALQFVQALHLSANGWQQRTANAGAANTQSVMMISVFISSCMSLFRQCASRESRRAA